MNTRLTKKLLALGALLSLAQGAHAAQGCVESSSSLVINTTSNTASNTAVITSDHTSDHTARLLAQAAPPASAASAPAAEAQPENREAPARPAARRRGVGVVISMNQA